jgi:hypothetical protein
MRSAGACFNHQPPLHSRRDGSRNGFRMAGWSPLRPATGPPVRAGPASRAGPGRAHSCASSSSKGNSSAAAATAAPAAGAAAAPPPLLMSRYFQACTAGCTSSVLAASARCSALMSSRHTFHAASVMLKSCRTRFVICLEEPEAVGGVTFAHSVPVHQRRRYPPLVS